MHEAQDGEPNQSPAMGQPSPYLKLPWPPVAAALLAVLVLALAVGLAAARSALQPRTIPTVSATAVATAPPASTPVTSTQAAGTPLRVAVAPATPAASPLAAAATPADTPAAAPPAAETPAPPASGATALPTPTLQPTPLPTVDPALAEEVGQAYQHYWDVRAQALYTLDPSELPEVAAGAHLNSLTQFIDELQREGHAIRTDVTHHFTVVSATISDAQVVDDYTDNSVYVDPSSGEALDQPNSDRLEELYVLQKLDDNWRVVSLGRAH